MVAPCLSSLVIGDFFKSGKGAALAQTLMPYGAPPRARRVLYGSRRHILVASSSVSFGAAPLWQRPARRRGESEPSHLSLPVEVLRWGEFMSTT